jgi:hypothetical protein
MFGLRKWKTTFMLPKLGDIDRGTCPILLKRLCFHMVEDNEVRGREDPWLHMGILQRTH